MSFDKSAEDALHLSLVQELKGWVPVLICNPDFQEVGDLHVAEFQKVAALLFVGKTLSASVKDFAKVSEYVRAASDLADMLDDQVVDSEVLGRVLSLAETAVNELASNKSFYKHVLGLVEVLKDSLKFS